MEILVGFTKTWIEKKVVQASGKRRVVYYDQVLIDEYDHKDIRIVDHLKDIDVITSVENHFLVDTVSKIEQSGISFSEIHGFYDAIKNYEFQKESPFNCLTNEELERLQGRATRSGFTVAEYTEQFLIDVAGTDASKKSKGSDHLNKWEDAITKNEKQLDEYGYRKDLRKNLDDAMNDYVSAHNLKDTKWFDFANAMDEADKYLKCLNPTKNTSLVRETCEDLIHRQYKTYEQELEEGLCLR